MTRVDEIQREISKVEANHKMDHKIKSILLKSLMKDLSIAKCIKEPKPNKRENSTTCSKIPKAKPSKPKSVRIKRDPIKVKEEAIQVFPLSIIRSLNDLDVFFIKLGIPNKDRIKKMRRYWDKYVSPILQQPFFHKLDDLEALSIAKSAKSITPTHLLPKEGKPPIIIYIPSGGQNKKY